MKDCCRPFLSPRFLLLIFVLITFPYFSHNQLSSLNSLYKITDNKTQKIKRSSIWKINESEDLEKTVKKNAEEVTFFQSLLRDLAVSKVQEELAEVSAEWANVAQKVISAKYREVIHLTRKTQEAQLLSLTYMSTAQLLEIAVLKASRVHSSALQRFKALSVLSESAENNLIRISKALSLVQYILSIRDKWAREERVRALRLSQLYLRTAFEDLKATMQFSHDASFVASQKKLTSKLENVLS